MPLAKFHLGTAENEPAKNLQLRKLQAVGDLRAAAASAAADLRAAAAELRALPAPAAGPSAADAAAAEVLAAVPSGTELRSPVADMLPFSPRSHEACLADATAALSQQNALGKELRAALTAAEEKASAEAPQRCFPVNAGGCWADTTATAALTQPSV